MKKGEAVLYGVGVLAIVAVYAVLFYFPNGIGGYHG